MKYTLTASTFAMGALASAGFAVLGTPDRAQAQSFSCANAQIPSEMAVCNNEILLIKDERLAELLADAIIRASGSEKIQKISAQHGLWLKQRNTCKVNFECLGASYDKRIKELTDDARPLQTASISDRF